MPTYAYSNVVLVDGGYARDIGGTFVGESKADVVEQVQQFAPWVTARHVRTGRGRILART